MSGRTLIVGSRGSRLALTQTERVRAGLAGSSKLEIIRTSGDRFVDKPLSSASGIGLFTSEIEAALRSGRIDVAVHSLKDLPTQLEEGLALGAVLARHAAEDLLLLKPELYDAERPLGLPAGARVGTSSPRRQRLLARLAPEAQCLPIRGNVPTRVAKAVAGDFDALILARAGVERLALDVSPLKAWLLNPEIWPCAPGQAAIAVEQRAGDEATRQALASLEHAHTRLAVASERRLLRAFGGGCHAPFGAYARMIEARWRLDLAAPDGEDCLQLATFFAAQLPAAEAEARAWIGAGCPSRPATESPAWMCRPAPPWC